MNEHWIDDNGILRKMNAEEMNEIKQLQDETPPIVPPLKEQIHSLQDQVNDLTLALADMLGGNSTV